MLSIINSHRSIIFLDGSLPPDDLMKKINTKKRDVTIIAADGAANKLRALGLTPHYIIGDGDSQKSPIRKKVVVIKDPDQDTTDFEKCIVFAKNNNLFPSLILGVGGGELDHILGNCQAFLKHAENGNLYFLDTYEKENGKKESKEKIGVKLGLALTPGKVSLKMREKSLLSLFSFEKAAITTKGLRWEVTNKTLSTKGILALRNETKDGVVEFEVRKGKALLIVDIALKDINGQIRSRL